MFSRGCECDDVSDSRSRLRCEYGLGRPAPVDGERVVGRVEVEEPGEERSGRASEQHRNRRVESGAQMNHGANVGARPPPRQSLHAPAMRVATDRRGLAVHVLGLVRDLLSHLGAHVPARGVVLHVMADVEGVMASRVGLRAIPLLFLDAAMVHERGWVFDVPRRHVHGHGHRRSDERKRYGGARSTAGVQRGTRHGSSPTSDAGGQTRRRHNGHHAGRADSRPCDGHRCESHRPPSRVTSPGADSRLQPVSSRPPPSFRSPSSFPLSFRSWTWIRCRCSTSSTSWSTSTAFRLRLRSRRSHCIDRIRPPSSQPPRRGAPPYKTRETKS